MPILSFHTSEMLGFMDFMSYGFPYGREVRQEVTQLYPKLNEKNIAKAWDEFEKMGGIPFLKEVEEVKDIRQLHQYILDVFGKEKASSLNVLADELYGVYKPLYQLHAKRIAGQVNKINQVYQEKASAVDALFHSFANFTGTKIPDAYSHATYLFPAFGRIANGRCLTIFSIMGVSKFEIDIARCVPIAVHEFAHTITGHSDIRKKMAIHFQQENNPITPILKANPNLRLMQHGNTANVVAASLFDETLVTSLQAIAESQLGIKRNGLLYQDPLVHCMAIQMIPVVKKYMEQGKKLDVNFIKTFEEKFLQLEIKNNGLDVSDGKETFALVRSKGQSRS